MRSEIHVGNTTTFRLKVRNARNLGYTLTGATVTIYLVKPSGAKLTKSGTLYNETQVQYTTLTTDLDTAGDWQIYAKIVSGSVELYTDVLDFTVYANP